MKLQRLICTVTFATSVVLGCSQFTWADEEPAKPFFSSYWIREQQRSARDLAWGWANNPWQPLAAPFGGFQGLDGQAYGGNGASPSDGSNYSPSQSSTTAPQVSWQQQAMQAQWQQQAAIQMYYAWLASRNRSAGPGRMLPGQGATSNGDGCGPGTHLSFAYATLQIPGLRSGGSPCNQCFVAGTPVILGDGTSKAIDALHVGDRVRADRSTAEVVDAANWRRLELRCAKPDGTHAEVVLLRPLSWLDEHGAKVGGRVPLSVPECGIDGSAEVLSISSCPAISSGNGKIVTGTYCHTAPRTLDVYVEGQTDPIGTTANHLFWSENRQAFVRADRLYSGERLYSVNAKPKVVGLMGRPAAATVYNLEIQGGQVFHVGPLGIAVAPAALK
jgi:hypothetical protein